MSNKIKREIDRIQVPPELQQRSILGIQQAHIELKHSRRRTRNRSITVIAASLLGLVLLTSVMFNTHVVAAIQKALQFVPGIGMVKEEDAPTNTYMLKQPITVQVGEGAIVITGIMIDEQMTYITMTGTDTSRFESIKLINGHGTEFTVKRSLSSWSSNEWVASFWQKGKLDIQEQATLIIETNQKLKVPLTLVKAETYASYSDMGETATTNGVSITAIANRVGEKARISLVAQHTKEYRIVDYGIYGIYMHEDKKLNVMDRAGNNLEVENIRGISAPASEFYFKISEEDSSYILTLPEINVRYNDQLSITIPSETTDNLNKTFEIAGLPVTVTSIERISDTMLRVYVDLHYNEQSARSLHMFSIDSMSHGGQMNDQTGELEYLEFEIEPDSRQVNLKLVHPEVILRGPWKFELPAEKYFLK